jgi:hypothetical protein
MVKQENVNLPKMLLLFLLHENRCHIKNNPKTKAQLNKAQVRATTCQLLNESFKILRFPSRDCDVMWRKVNRLIICEYVDKP